jgi:hypothetical protein
VSRRPLRSRGLVLEEFSGKVSPVHHFWHTFAEPAFYAYTAPEPAGLAEEPLAPEAAGVEG